MRVLALHRDYYAFDLSKCYHYIALELTRNEASKRVLTEFLASGGEQMKQLAEFYGKYLETVKTWFHAFSNNKQKANWLKENSFESTHELIDRWIGMQNNVTKEMCELYPEVFEKRGKQAPKLRSYVNQCEEAKAREVMEAYFGECCLGPPMHDGISVLKHGLESPESVAEKLSAVVTEALGYKTVVHHEVIEAERLECMCSFSRKDIVSNHEFQYETIEAFGASLDRLAEQCSCYFVCMTKMESDAVVELEYSPGSDRISKHTIRTSANTMQTHPGMLIVTQVERVEATDKDDEPILDGNGKAVYVYEPKKYEPLLSWYIRDERRREKHRIGVYFLRKQKRANTHTISMYLVACHLTNDLRTSQSKSALRLSIRLKRSQIGKR